MDLVGGHVAAFAEASKDGFGGDLFGLDLGDPSADDAGVGAGVESGAVAVQPGGTGG
ncbi:hypothetical protein AB0L86_26375 [Micromonospora musae]|uniref:hypothetical protein n=1 Tax=Micromonospora musae TaxID=1894970 RepID=UPI0034233F5F